jgi:hypothetical protein
LTVPANRQQQLVWAAALSVLLHLAGIGFFGMGQRPALAPSTTSRASKPMVWITAAPLSSVSPDAIALQPTGPAGLVGSKAAQPPGRRSASRSATQDVDAAQSPDAVARPALPSQTEVAATAVTATPTARLNLDFNQAVKESSARTPGAVPVLQNGPLQNRQTPIEQVFDNALGQADRPLKETRNPDGSGLIQLAKGGCITVPNPNLSRRPPGALLVVTNCPR